MSFKTPAPGSYSPEKVHPQGERYAPAWSCGARTRYRKRKWALKYTITPCMASKWQTLSSCCPKTKSPSVRQNSHNVILFFFFILLGDSTPSPNSYSLPALLGSKIPNRYSSASFSMTGRAKTGGFAEDLAKTPGPGNYRTVDPVVYKKRDPAYSMNQRSYMPGGKYLKCNRYHLLQLF